MKYGVYAIRDQLVGYMQPTIAVNDDVALRQFSVLINQDKSGTLLTATPQYFDLYKIGEYDDDDGSLKAVKPVQLVVTGISVKKGEPDGEV